ncbi:MAG: DNA-processing protein DprA [Lachnospiraceae bacterium]|nr:DNA-processing protein DprA [Candidatus Equihabitans merdae]
MREIHRDDEDYPEKLRRYKGMPETLYVEGKLPGNEPTVAIIGARRCSAYGKRMANLFGSELAKAGITVISGMAAGIDGQAQRAALSEDGLSYGVLGSGVDICYPTSNRGLYTDLIKKGGILSEQPPGSPPLAQFFPARNRIISALADVVLVIEARKRSGSLITVEFALEQGKSVFAVPGRIGDLLSDGCNELIYDGAGIAVSPQTIMDELRRIRPDWYNPVSEEVTSDTTCLPICRATANKGQKMKHTARENVGTKHGVPDHFIYEETAHIQMTWRDISFENVMKCLSDDPVSLDELLAKTGMESAEITGILTDLILENKIEERGSQQYVRL